MTDLDYMRRAMELALRGKGKTSPNPMVGALVVRQGKIVGEGWHRYCGAEHAEVMALREAGIRTRGARLYVTLEPCRHFGRTPPCVEAIFRAGIKEVVVGMKDPNPVNNGKSLDKLRRQGIKVKIGFLKEELTRLNEVFIKYITQELPFVAAKCAQTLDGKIATAAQQSKWITGEKARQYAHRLRNDFDAILVGINTVLKDNPGLNADSSQKHLKKIILDSRLRLPLTAKLFQKTPPEEVVVATTENVPPRRWQAFARRGVTLIKCPAGSSSINLPWLFKELAKREISNILIEGGAHTIGQALKAGLIDKFLVFLSPKIIGDQQALSSVVGIKANHVKDAVRLHRLSIQPLGEDLLIEGYVHRNR